MADPVPSMIADGERVAAWLRHQAMRSPADFWAWEMFHTINSEDPRRAWRVVVALIAAAPDEAVDGVGAGPVEDFVSDHASAYIEAIEARAASHSKFQECLATIWLSRDDLVPEVLSRVVAASGGRILVADIDETFEPEGHRP